MAGRWMLTALLLGVGLTGAWRSVLGEDAPPRASIDRTLDGFHEAAAKADGPRYFSHLTEDAVFLGTDASERWPRKEFEAFASPYFKKGKGWTYTSTERQVDIEVGGDLAWFDELLTNEHYGTCRGSGVLRKQAGQWRIAQYNLSIPMPNPLARDFVERIRGHAAGDRSTAVLYIVRHAEKGAGSDPDLTAAGHARALRLCRLLRSAELEKIYATEFKRTQQTVAPSSTHLGIPISDYKAAATAALAARLRADKTLKAALIAGHSNTVPALLKQLGVKPPAVLDMESFDNLLIVQLRGGAAPTLQHLHYGGR